MRRIILALLTLLPAAGTASCVKSERAAGETITKAYKVTGFRWASGTTVYVVYKVGERNGRTAVCGAWAADGGEAALSEFNRQVLSGARVSINGVDVVDGILYFPRYADPKNVIGRPANCELSEIAWRPEFANARTKITFAGGTFVD